MITIEMLLEFEYLKCKNLKLKQYISTIHIMTEK